MTKATNNYITIRAMETMREGMIHLPQTQTQRCIYGIVTSVGEKVLNKSIRVDSIILCESSSILEVKGSIFVKEESCLMIRHKNIMRPLGRKILVQRMVEEIQTESGVIIPSCYKSTDQSLHCVFIFNGIINDEIYDPDFGLMCGDTVRLKDWQHHMKEIEINGVYHLIVKPSDILYTTNDSDILNRIVS